MTMTLALLLLAAAPLVAPADTAPAPPRIAYVIEASLDESTDVLTGRARLTYVNRSGGAIDTLWFHQHLNAFRPNSAWAQREMEYREDRFQRLGPEEHAFERLTSVRVDGVEVAPVHPGAPDSTVVAVPLPSPLSSGDSTVVVLDWQARLSTLPRRQGRRGRHYDFAQWYPRIAVHKAGQWFTQPLLPQGEFYGEFATYDVTVELPRDQVMGATGVPVEGDPGWEAAAVNGTGEVLYQRERYGASPRVDIGLLAAEPAEGRKQVRWRAEEVHHFAWSANPRFIYEQGTALRAGEADDPIVLRVLYLPADTGWANGVALERTEVAITWLQDLFGPYLWPQLTNLHRIEPGGTEFPMMMMNGSPSMGLILHEAGHQYLHGMLANNEWAEGWMDEGFQSFVDDWFAEEQGQADVWQGSLQQIRQVYQAGMEQPIGLASADFVNPAVYSMMTYVKPALVLRMLRELVGEETMREILREYFARHAPGHVTEADLRQVVRDVTGRDHDWFFDQWIHTDATVDYSVAEASTERTGDGRWRTRVVVRRDGDAWMPVEVEVAGERRELTGPGREQVVEFVTRERPESVVVDPDGVLIDLQPQNNRRTL